MRVTDVLLDLMPTNGWRTRPGPTYGVLPLGLAAINLMAAIPYDSLSRDPLEQLLSDARSVYMIRTDGRALVRRLDPAVAAVTDAAAKAADQPERGSATRHLQQAFDAAYALQPDPGKAYGEAIKAVEAAAHATLEPNRPLATLGTMIREFRQVRDRVSVPITGKSGTEGREVIESMMNLLWTGQTSRHGNRQVTRQETLQEALMAVHLASVLVQFYASGAVHRS